MANGAEDIQGLHILPPDFSGSVFACRRQMVAANAAYGYANRGHAERNTPTTAFQIASISKTFTAAAVLLLQEQGKLSVHTPITDYVEGSPAPWQLITLHHLLTHSSGIGHWQDFREIDLFAPKPREEIIRIFQSGLLRFTPGTGWSYSSPGYVLLAHVVEQVSGQSYGAFLHEHILALLDLRSTGAGNDPRIAAQRAAGYDVDKPVRLFDLDQIGIGAGDLWSTTGDLARWNRALASPGLLNADSLRAMFAPQVRLPGGGRDIIERHYGYGWFMGRMDERRIVYHPGDNAGFQAFNAWFPDDDAVVIVLANDQREDVVRTGIGLARAMFSLPPGAGSAPASKEGPVERRRGAEPPLELPPAPGSPREASPPVGTPPAFEPGDGITADSPHAHVLDEDVQFTVYRPKVVQPERWYTMLAFAHKTEVRTDPSGRVIDPVAKMQQQAGAILGDALKGYSQTADDSRTGIAWGSELRFVPVVDGVEFYPPFQSFLWAEDVHRAEFQLKAAARLDGQQARGRLSIFLGAVLIGDVSLSFRINAATSVRARAPEDVADSARPYRKIFASYSHHDLPVVEQFAMLVRITGDEFVRDWTHLRAGERWDDRLLGMITEADIFELFWSANSMKSPFVQREWSYALSLNRPHFIRPVYWEDPLPSIPDQNLPPAELLSLHFQKLDFGVASGGPEPAHQTAPGMPQPIPRPLSPSEPQSWSTASIGPPTDPVVSHPGAGAVPLPALPTAGPSRAAARNRRSAVISIPIGIALLVAAGLAIVSRPNGHPSPTPALTAPRISVAPNPVRAGGIITVTVRTSPGAICRNVLTYSNGARAASSNSRARTAGASGRVSFAWHIVTRATHGAVTAKCSLHGQSMSSSVSFGIVH